jgi:hypothetical protein
MINWSPGWIVGDIAPIGTVKARNRPVPVRTKRQATPRQRLLEDGFVFAGLREEAGTMICWR